MKKLLTVLVALFAFVALASAQPRAIGVRALLGGELSYQHSLGENFLEADLGWWNNGFSLAAAYDFSIAPVGPFNFYAGPAAQLFSYGYDNGDGTATTRAAVGVGGQLGLEYFFDAIPLQISLDWRPMFNIGYAGHPFGWEGIALGLRYAF